MSNDLVTQLEEAYRRDLKNRRWQKDAVLSEGMRRALFQAIAEEVRRLKNPRPESIAILVHGALYSEGVQNCSILPDYGSFVLWSKTVFEVLCGDAGQAATAFAQFNRLDDQTPRQ